MGVALMVMGVIQILRAENATGQALEIKTSPESVEVELSLFVSGAP